MPSKVLIDGVEYVPMPEPVDVESLQGALEVRFDSDAGDNITVRDYLRILLETLWDEKEGFSGKRPFGNSDWEFNLYEPLMEAGFLDAYEDEQGRFLRNELDAAHLYVRSLIRAAFATSRAL